MKKVQPTIHHLYYDMYNLIDNGSIDEVIAFAKEYNIFQESNSQFYTNTCEKIKQRLELENLSIEVVRP